MVQLLSFPTKLKSPFPKAGALVSWAFAENSANIKMDKSVILSFISIFLFLSLQITNLNVK
jgi:hypothetical protein